MFLHLNIIENFFWQLFELCILFIYFIHWPYFFVILAHKFTCFRSQLRNMASRRPMNYLYNLILFALMIQHIFLDGWIPFFAPNNRIIRIAYDFEETINDETNRDIILSFLLLHVFYIEHLNFWLNEQSCGPHISKLF